MIRALRLGLLLLAFAGAARAASPPAMEAANGMVVSAQRLASEAGLEMLRRGGNAVDAAGKPVPGASTLGWKAVAVPGSVLGLDTALAEYGTLPRAVVMAPAIRLAREGFVLTRGDADILGTKAAVFRARPALARIFLRPDGSPPPISLPTACASARRCAAPIAATSSSPPRRPAGTAAGY